ncbi:MAG: hypothetical protein LBU32_28060 [Clostridiales bacterium]|jgi:hypothetical protein|nr:hypothetical protein [Clostridiales bacterium]
MENQSPQKGAFDENRYILEKFLLRSDITGTEARMDEENKQLALEIN